MIQDVNSCEYAVPPFIIAKGNHHLGGVANGWAVFCAARRIERVCSVVEL